MTKPLLKLTILKMVFILFGANPTAQAVELVQCHFCSTLDGVPLVSWNNSISAGQQQFNLLIVDDIHNELNFDSHTLREVETHRALEHLQLTRQLDLLLEQFKSYIRGYIQSVQLPGADLERRLEFQNQVFSKIEPSLGGLRASGLLTEGYDRSLYFAFLPIVIIFELSADYHVPWDQRKSFVAASLKFIKQIDEARRLLVKDFDLVDRDESERHHRDQFSTVLQDFLFKLNRHDVRLQRHKLYERAKELEVIDSLDPDKESPEHDFLAHYSERLYAPVKQQLEQLKQATPLQPELDTREALLTGAANILYTYFYPLEPYTSVQTLLARLPELQEQSHRPDSLYELEQVVQEITDKCEDCKRLLDFISKHLEEFSESEDPLIMVNYSKKLIPFLIDDIGFRHADLDRALTKNSRYNSLDNIYFYMRGISDIEFSDLHNPPFQICRKTLKHFENVLQPAISLRKQEQTGIIWKARDYFSQRLSFPPENEIYEQMVLQGESKSLAEQQRYQARSFLFLNRCTDMLSEVHFRALLAANAVYGIDFTSPEKAEKGDTSVKVQIPQHEPVFEHYRVVKTYGHQPESCRSTGLKVIQLEPKDQFGTPHTIFAIAGTEFDAGLGSEGYIRRKLAAPLDDAVTDIFYGKPQVETVCTKLAIRDAIAIASSATDKRDVIFTGHSLGGALAQAFGYLAQKELMTDHFGHIHVVSWNGFGASQTLRLVLEIDQLDYKVIERILGVTYFMRNDAVSKIGTHFLETRRLQDKVDFEFLKGIQEHRIGVMNKSIINDFFERLDYTIPAQPEPNAVINTVGDTWFGMMSWFNKRFSDE
jgi:hypothetical protein